MRLIRFGHREERGLLRSFSEDSFESIRKIIIIKKNVLHVNLQTGATISV